MCDTYNSISNKGLPPSLPFYTGEVLPKYPLDAKNHWQKRLGLNDATGADFYLQTTLSTIEVYTILGWNIRTLCTLI